MKNKDNLASSIIKKLYFQKLFLIGLIIASNFAWLMFVTQYDINSTKQNTSSKLEEACTYTKLEFKENNNEQCIRDTRKVRKKK